MTSIEDQLVPQQLAALVKEFWPESEWDHAVSVAHLESDFNQWALADTTDDNHPCGTLLKETTSGTKIYAERSIGWFQINTCYYPETPWFAWCDARSNVGQAHALWSDHGWWPWYFSARKLGLL